MKNRFKIHYLEISKNDLDQIFDYILKDSPANALKILDEIDEGISKLSQFPELGRQPKDDKLKAFGYRILILSNYLIFYIVKEDIIEIHRILHGSRDYQNIL